MLKLRRLNGLCDGPAVCGNGKLMGGEKGTPLGLVSSGFYVQLFFLTFDFLGCIAGEGT